MNWFDSLPAVDAAMPCGSGTHSLRWEAGQLTLPSHPDAEAELVLGALGGEKPACVTMAEAWTRHATDFAVLAAGPRCAADQVSIEWDEVTRQRANMATALAATVSYPGSTSAPGTRPSRAIRIARAVRGGPGAVGGPGSPMPGLGIDPLAEKVRDGQQRLEVVELLALGPALQFRLSGTVCAAWAAPDRAAERAARRPEFAAALTGRFAPAAEEWLGIDPDAVTVTTHDGSGWGAMELTGTGRDRRLRAALPVGWLADVWACGLAAIDGHLVVAVEEPGYPQARVLALAAPGAAPVALTVRAKADGPAGLPAWEIAGRA